ncbi:hypothetical protein E3P99_01684 [Wallemia hederae]|uniref:CCHC-type domain-containing protein n=1 Tax=Wallemia hederae TaxID=1540922 RepID=A0A4T0FPR0_9BASI|nr:hypothetical protein E3P99_01684 [Wallemia hederae]
MAKSSNKGDEDGGEDQLFFVDTQPDEQAHTAIDDDKSKTKDGDDDGDKEQLALPEYINVNLDDPADTQNHRIRVLDGDEKDYTENDSDFVDIDQHGAGPARYFQEEVNKHEYTVCRTCKQTGHLSKDCPHMICLTCGAVDEHRERDCPISLICYNCGGRGHFARVELHNTEAERLKAQLSQMRLAEPSDAGVYDAITVSLSHTRAQACLTLWRIYQYVDAKDFDNKGKAESNNDAELKEVQQIRAEMWCYNCANPGHLGDDCGERRGCPIPLIEPSAFSEQNLTSGPFKNALLGGKKGKSNAARRAKQLDKASGYPSNARIPDRGGPGFEKKRKEKEHLKRLADESSDDSDDYDRFLAELNGIGDGPSKKSRKNRPGQRQRDDLRRKGGRSSGGESGGSGHYSRSSYGRHDADSDRDSLLNSRRRCAVHTNLCLSRLSLRGLKSSEARGTPTDPNRLVAGPRGEVDMAGVEGKERKGKERKGKERKGKEHCISSTT